MEILRAVVDEEENIECEVHRNIFEVLGAVVTVINAVHETCRRKTPLMGTVFRRLLTDYLVEESDNVFAPIEDEDLTLHADFSLLGNVIRNKRKESEDRNGDKNNHEH